MNDILVVGSGVGGATIAKELATMGRKVTLIEKGHHHKLGTERRSLGFVGGARGPYGLFSSSPGEKTPEGTEIIRAFMVGGTSTITFANGVRCLQKQLSALGVDLEDEFIETEKELKIEPVPDRILGERTKLIMKAADELGYEIKPMPKFIDFTKCRSCGMCVTGCQYGAKWSSQRFVGQALGAGAKLLIDTTVDRILTTNGKVKGVHVQGPSGDRDVEAETVVISAGGLGTPGILQRSGIAKAGTNLFADLLVNTYGLLRDRDMKSELGMAALVDQFHEKDGFILSPIVDTTLDMFLYLPLFKKQRAFARGRTIGIMTKTTDDDDGRIDPDGTIHKPVTENDRRKLDRGDQIAREILTKIGVEPSTLYTTGVRAGHPGGTAGIGRVVNTDLETEISGLFVSDASVLPTAPGLPPVVTIVALSKRLSKRLAE
jgi:choline dehydrogenase-like flavoprotein